MSYERRKRNHRVKMLARVIRAGLLVIAAVSMVIGAVFWFSGRPAQKQEKENSQITKQKVEKNTEKDMEQEDARSMEAEEESAESAQPIDTSAAKDEAGDAEPPVREEPVSEIDANVEVHLQSMTLEQKVAQLFIITPEALTGASTVTAAGDATKQALQKYPVAGLIYFSKNLVAAQQIKAMTANATALGQEIEGVPLFLSVDEEGGSVARLADTEALALPKVSDMADIGASGDIGKAYEAALTISTYLKEYGFNLDFAPDADVLLSDENTVVKKRSFGSDGALVADMVGAQLQAFEENEILCTLKHFPGHGATSGDTHNGYAYTDRTLEQMKERELLPFVKGIENQVPFIMAGHFAAPALTGNEEPCSLSYEVLTHLLREDMQYQGIIITDAMNMGAISEQYTSGEAAVQAIKAGCDIILMPQDFEGAYQAVLDAVSSGQLSKERIDESVRRILKVKLQM